MKKLPRVWIRYCEMGHLMGDEDVDGGVMGGTCTTSLTLTDIS